jgi:hypothetical protein
MSTACVGGTKSISVSPQPAHDPPPVLVRSVPKTGLILTAVHGSPKKENHAAS